MKKKLFNLISCLRKQKAINSLFVEKNGASLVREEEKLLSTIISVKIMRANEIQIKLFINVI
jgi:hypothetical protein